MSYPGKEIALFAVLTNKTDYFISKFVKHSIVHIFCWNNLSLRNRSAEMEQFIL